MESILGRLVESKISFKASGVFKSLQAAQVWLYENGYTGGSLDAKNPIAITKEKKYHFPEKWHNLTKYDKAIIDGVIMSNDFRNGEVNVYIFKDTN